MLKTITVRELLDRLRDEDPEMPVIVSADYGDRGRTQQALGLKGRLDEVTLRPTPYSASGYAVADGEEDEEPSTYLLLG